MKVGDLVRCKEHPQDVGIITKAEHRTGYIWATTQSAKTQKVAGFVVAAWSNDEDNPRVTMHWHPVTYLEETVEIISKK